MFLLFCLSYLLATLDNMTWREKVITLSKTWFIGVSLAKRQNKGDRFNDDKLLKSDRFFSQNNIFHSSSLIINFLTYSFPCFSRFIRSRNRSPNHQITCSLSDRIFRSSNSALIAFNRPTRTDSWAN